MATTKKILEVEGVSKKFTLQKSTGGVKNSPDFIYALKDVFFSLNRGESIGIIGKNGSGKSTLLKILSGVLKPDAGLVKIYGSFASILDLGFGMVPEFTGRENIFLVGSLSGYSKAQMREIMDEIVDFAELEEFIDQPVKNFSNGMYLRLAFAIKTILRADLLILDEVMAVGDIKFQEKCKLKIKQLHSNGTSIIIVTHSLREVAEYTKRSFILDKGEMVNMGYTMDIINQYETLSGLNQLKVDPSVNYAANPNNALQVMDYNLSSHKIKMSEKISFSISLQVKEEGAYDIMVFVSDFNSILFSDSFSYRSAPPFTISKPFNYTCNCEVPPNFFNKGAFHVGYVISDGKNSLYENMRCLGFEVEMDENISISPWSVNDKVYSLRPELKWELKYTAG